jgi:sugar lactone lactonase YvrE
MKRVLLCAAAALGAAAIGVAAAQGDRVIVNPRALYPEGPVHDGAGGGYYYAEMGGDRVQRWDGTANRLLWARPGCGPTSVAHFAGDLVVLCHMEEALVRISRAGVTLGMVSRDRNGMPFQTPNASANDAEGGVYFSSSGLFSPSAPAQGAVLYLAKSGALSRVAEGIHYANGVAVSRDGATLYVSEHLNRQVLAYTVGAPGVITAKRVFVRLDDLMPADPRRGWEVGPDGLATDQAGNLYVAEYGAGRLLIVGKDGRLRATIPVDERYITAPALSPDERHILITAPASSVDPRQPGKIYFVPNPVFGKG